MKTFRSHAALAFLTAALAALPSAGWEFPWHKERGTDAYCLQASFLSPGFTWDEEGPGALDLFDFADFLDAPKKTGEKLYRRAVCPVDIGILGIARARSTAGFSVNVFANTATNLGRQGYQFEDVLPEREACCSFAGIQLSGVGNIFEDVSGLQFAGGFNTLVYGRGLQAAGLANTVFDFSGVQLAVLLNFAETSRGVQVGLFNVATNGGCLQLGLLNVFSGAAKGLQIGLLNANIQQGFLPVLNFAY